MQLFEDFLNEKRLKNFEKILRKKVFGIHKITLAIPWNPQNENVDSTKVLWNPQN